MALIVARFDSLVVGSLVFGSWAPPALIVAAVLLMAACVAGAVHRYLSKEIVATKRRKMTLLMKQNVGLLYDVDSENEAMDLQSLSLGVCGAQYLQGEDKEHWKKFKAKDKRFEKWPNRVPTGQQLFAGVGYLLLPACAAETAS